MQRIRFWQSGLVHVAPVAIVASLAVPATAAPVQLFWYSASGTISTGSSAGGSTQTIVSGSNLDGGLAVDGVHGWLYWTYSNYPFVGGGIKRASIDGTNVQTVYTNAQNRPLGIVVDPEGGRIYFGDTDDSGSTGTIRSANLDGTGAQIVRSGLNQPWGLALDSIHDRIYWTNLTSIVGAGASIGGCNTDGSDAQTIVSTGLSNPRGLAVDAASGQLFWTDNLTHRIERSTTGGTDRTTLLSYDTPDGMVFDPASSRIYWADFASPGKILTADSDGGDVGTVFTGLGYPRNVTIAVPEPALALALITAGGIFLLRPKRV